MLFFATLYGKCTESALPLMNLLDILTVENIFRLQLLKFSHQWHKKQLPSIFDEYFHYASDVHSYHTRYAAKGNFYKARFRTKAGKKNNISLVSRLLASIANWNEKPQFLFFSKKSQTIPVVEAKLIQLDFLPIHYLFSVLVRLLFVLILCVYRCLHTLKGMDNV